MSDALHLEQRLHDLVAGWRRRHESRRSVPRQSAREMERQVAERLFAARRPAQSPMHLAELRSAREMERQAVQRLFAARRPAQSPMHLAELKSAREMERRAVERLYGGRSNVVVRDEHEPGGEGT
jgi:transcription initiation factor TFIIIB Brf1 subunit/transcription initiation factor TFIIB